MMKLYVGVMRFTVLDRVCRCSISLFYAPYFLGINCLIDVYFDMLNKPSNNNQQVNPSLEPEHRFMQRIVGLEKTVGPTVEPSSSDAPGHRLPRLEAW